MSISYFVFIDKFKRSHCKRCLMVPSGTRFRKTRKYQTKVNTSIKRDSTLIYLTALFGLLTVATTGVPLALGRGSTPSEVGAGYCIVILGLIPILYIIYKLMLNFSIPTITSKRAKLWYVVTFSGFFLINVIVNFVHNIDAIKYALNYIYAIYSTFLVLSWAAINVALREKGIKTYTDIIDDNLKNILNWWNLLKVHDFMMRYTYTFYHYYFYALDPSCYSEYHTPF